MHNFNAQQAQRADIAQIFGVHPSTVSRWKKAGCPVNPDSTYSAPAVHKWLVDQATLDMTDKEAGTCDSPALERYREARADIVELDLEVKKGTLIAKDEVSREWALRVAELCAGLEFLSDRLPPLLVGRAREEIQRIIGDEIWRLRDQYRRAGRFCEMEEG